MGYWWFLLLYEVVPMLSPVDRLVFNNNNENIKSENLFHRGSRS